MARKFYKVLYDFKAQGEVELDVSAGTYVLAAEHQPDEGEGWLQVQIIHGERSEGFVPSDYVEEVTEQEALSSSQGEQGSAKHGPAQPHANGHHGARHTEDSASDAGNALNGSISSLGLSTGHGQTQPQRPGATTPSTHQGSATGLMVSEEEAVTVNARIVSSGSALHQPSEAQLQSFALSSLHTEDRSGVHHHHQPLSPSAGSEAHKLPPRDTVSSVHSHTGGLVESFMKNEVYFRSLMKQRQETFMRLDSCISDTASEIAACKSKNSLLAKKVRELDNMIEEDRAKWRGRIDEEKRLLMSQASGAMRYGS